MSTTRWFTVTVAAMFAAALVGGANLARGADVKDKLPDAVSKAFKAEFPKGEIVKAEEEKENGVTVYDIEFKDGSAKRETDIAADGTILEVSVVVDAKDVPEAAMKAIQAAAAGATIKELSKAEVRCQAKDGKIVKLDKPQINYEAALTKGDQSGEVTVDEKGTVVEPVKWEKAK